MRTPLYIALGLLVAWPAAGSGQGVLRKFSFDSGTEGWTALGSATATVVTSPAAAKEGTGALKVEYKIAKGEMGALVFGVSGADLTPVKAVRMWVKADYATTIAVSLEENGGGRWIAPVAVPKGEWVKVELAPGDFNLMQGADDPKDPNSKLDLDNIGSVAIGDFNQFLIQLGDDTLVTMLGVQSGKHVLWLDEMELSGESLSPITSAASGEVRLDTLARPLPLWIGLGRMQLSITGTSPLTGRALEASYEMPQGAIAALLRQVTRGALANAESLSLTMASKVPVTLFVQVEEAGGGKYNTMLNLKGNRTVENLTLRFSEFQPAEDSKDTNGRLDLNEVVHILIGDLGALIGNPPADNTLWLNNLKSVTAK